MGKTMVITVPGATFTGPKFRVDPRLNNGSLILVDPAHASEPWAAGVSLSTVPNIAKREATALLGSPTGADTLAVTNTISATTGARERTAKGGLHVAVKQSGTVASEAWKAAISTQVAAYLNANPTHGLYASVWGLATRSRVIGSGSANIPLAGLRRNHSSIFTPWIDFAYASASGNVVPSPGTSDPVYINRAVGTLTSGVGAFRSAVGITGQPTSFAGQTLATSVIELGNTLSDSTNVAPSAVFYGFHLCDLTVAAAQWGVTVAQAYATLDAIDSAQYAAAFASGGRYFGDTYTAPATLAGA